VLPTGECLTDDVRTNEVDICELVYMYACGCVDGCLLAIDRVSTVKKAISPEYHAAV
jgi:hypothetical protein